MAKEEIKTDSRGALHNSALSNRLQLDHNELPTARPLRPTLKATKIQKKESWEKENSAEFVQQTHIGRQSDELYFNKHLLTYVSKRFLVFLR